MEDAFDMPRVGSGGADLFAAAAMLAQGEHCLQQSCSYCRAICRILDDCFAPACFFMTAAFGWSVFLPGAEEGDSDDSDDASEHVGREEFLLLTQSMLKTAQEQRDLLQQALQKGYANSLASSF